MSLMYKAACVIAAGLCVSVHAGLSQLVIVAPGEFVQAGAAPNGNGVVDDSDFVQFASAYNDFVCE